MLKACCLVYTSSEAALDQVRGRTDVVNMLVSKRYDLTSSSIGRLLDVRVLARDRSVNDLRGDESLRAILSILSRLQHGEPRYFRERRPRTVPKSVFTQHFGGELLSLFTDVIIVHHSAGFTDYLRSL